MKVKTMNEAKAIFRDYLKSERNKSASMEYWHSAEGIQHLNLMAALKFVVRPKSK